MKSDWEQHILLKSLTRQKKVKINEKIIANLKPDHFTIEIYKKAFRRINSYYVKRGRILTWKELVVDSSLPEKIRQKLKAKEVKRKKLKKYDSSVVLPGDFKEYVTLVDNVVYNSKHIQLIDLHNELSSSLSKQDLTIEEVDKILLDSDNRLNKIKKFGSNEKGQLFDLTKANTKSSLDVFHRKMENQFFLPTGFREFDSKNIGIPRDSFFVLSGKSGSGKSSIALQLSLNWRRFGLRVCYIPLEMSIEQMLFRISSNLLGISIVDLVRDYKKYRKKILKSIGKFVNNGDEAACFHFYVPDPEETYIDTLNILLPRKYDIIVDDMINLNCPVDYDDHKNLSQITRYAKVYSTNNGICNVALAQLDNEKEHIRYSRSVSENASNAWVWPETKDDVAELGHITVKQLKARNQNPFSFKLKADLAVCKFSDYIEESLDDYKGGGDLEDDVPDEDDV